MNNKRAEIPITILVIGIFLVCALALGSFMYASSKFSKSFYGHNLLEDLNSDVEQINTYRNLGYSLDDAVKLIETRRKFSVSGSDTYLDTTLVVEDSDFIITKTLYSYETSYFGAGDEIVETKKLLEVTRRVSLD